MKKPPNLVKRSLCIRTEYLSFYPVLNSAVHPHQGFFYVSESAGIFTAGKFAALETFEPVADDLQQISVQYTRNTLRVFPRSVLEADILTWVQPVGEMRYVWLALPAPASSTA